MNFSRKKLPKEAADNLRMCAIETIRAGALMPAPVYAYMKINEKFVAVKAPLDFFTDADLERYRGFGFLYFHEFVDRVAPFVSAARAVSSLLCWRPDLAWRPDSVEPTVLPPASFEIADAVLRLIGPLWSASGKIEPFFVAIFADELCQPLSPEVLAAARDRSVDAYEAAVFGSGWAVFLALHLGYCEIGFLARLREQVFNDISQGKVPTNDFNPISDLLRIAKECVAGPQLDCVSRELFDSVPGRASQKLRARLARLQSAGLIIEDSSSPSIHGERGFVDA